jgi:hypothetical protein
MISNVFFIAGALSRLLQATRFDANGYPVPGAVST